MIELRHRTYHDPKSNELDLGIPGHPSRPQVSFLDKDKSSAAVSEERPAYDSKTLYVAYTGEFWSTKL